MRKPLVAGNWKMHGSRVDNAALVRGLLDALKPESAARCCSALRPSICGRPGG